MKKFKLFASYVLAPLTFSTGAIAMDIDMTYADPFTAEILKSIGFLDSSANNYSRADEIKEIQQNAIKDITRNFVPYLFNEKKSDPKAFKLTMKSLLDFITNGTYFCATHINEDRIEIDGNKLSIAYNTPASFQSLLHDALYKKLLSEEISNLISAGKLVLNNLVNVNNASALESQQTAFFQQIEAIFRSKNDPQLMKDFAMQEISRLVKGSTYIFDPYMPSSWVATLCAPRTVQNVPVELAQFSNGKKPLCLVVFKNIEDVYHLLSDRVLRMAAPTPRSQEVRQEILDTFEL